MKVLLLVNGNAKNILSVNNFKIEEFEIIKIDEKRLAQPKSILNMIRKDLEEIYFGCISIEYQRFLPFMLIYILFSKPKKGRIIDEEGNRINFNFFRTIFVTIPLLAIELIASFFVVLYSYIYYFIWRNFKTSI